MPYAHEREGLWERLVSGRVTEVFVFGVADGSTLGTYLPQTLGLEPIVCDAYKYTRSGELRSYDELVQVAQQLAEGKRWVAEGGVPIWAATFMDRAQAILFFDTFRSRLVRSDPRQRGKDDVLGAERFAREHFPEKLLAITEPMQIQTLRRVRAVPAQQQAPGSTSAAEPGA